MNVWHDEESGDQWAGVSHHDRISADSTDFVRDVAHNPQWGIRRVGILRVKLKEQDDG